MSLVYEIGDFKGPIEVLYTMIDSKKLPIEKLSLLLVTEQFLEYIKTIEGRCTLDVLSRFLTIASSLLALKAHSFLPVLDSELDQNDQEFDMRILEHKIQMYACLRTCAKTLADCYENSEIVYTSASRWDKVPIFIASDTIHSALLSEVMRQLITDKVSEEKEYTQQYEERDLVVIKSLRTLEEEYSRILDEISKKGNFVLPSKTSSPIMKYESLVSFLAILEMLRSTSVEASQNTFDDDIFVYKLESLS